MKNKFFTAIIVAISFFTVFLPVFSPVSALNNAIPCPLANCDVISIFNTVVGLVRPIVIIALVGVIIYGGFTRMTAAGDPEKEKKSMQILTSGIVGFLIIVFAGFIVQFIGSLIGAGNLITNTP